jgi:hypothetical protein
MRNRCPGAELVGIAVLNGHRFLINSREVATIIKDDLAKVYGILWNISDEDERALDWYEGVSAGLYVKRHVEVTIATEEGVHVSALVYVAANSTPGRPRAGYLHAIIDAEERKGFPNEYIKELKERLFRPQITLPNSKSLAAPGDKIG